jgi:ligand-binding sensor domain-containing protein
MERIRKYILKGLLAAVVFFCIVFPMKAQQPYLRNYSVSEGLPSFEIYSMYQDSKGFLWFATDAGVSCYDGCNFRNFTSRDSLADNTIFGFYEDRKGRIWFRSYNGMLSYYDGEKIIKPGVNNALRNLPYGKLFLSLYIDKNDTIHLGLRDENSVVTVLPGFQEIDKQHPCPKGNCVREAEPGKFLISSDNAEIITGGICFYPLNSSAPIMLNDPRCNISHITCAKLSWNETILVFAGGHYLINGSTAELVNDSLQLIRVVPSKGNNFWACLAGRKGVELIEHRADGDKVIRRFLNGYSVTDCVEDREGGVWFTTLEQGVFYMPYREVEEQNFFQLGTGEKITAMTGLNSSRIIFSTSLGRILSPQSSVVPAAISATDKPGFISSLMDQGKVIAIGSSRNCLLFDEQLKKYNVVHDSAGQMPMVCVSEFDADQVCGVSINSVYLIDIHTGFAKLVCKSLPDRIRCICKGNGDTLWLGGMNGLWMLLPGQTPVNMSHLNVLLSQRIDFLFYDSNKKRLWMSSKGMGLLLKEGNKIIEISKLCRQMPPTCRSLNEDADGNLWVATNAGAFCVSETKEGTFSIRGYSIQNGLSSNDIVGIRHIGDTLWIAASDRLIRVRLDDYPHNLIPPPLIMRSILVNGHTIDTADKKGKLYFNTTDNTIAFSFTGISYKSFGQVHYRFRLTGADTAWKETESGEATFYKLPPGDYTFCLYAYNNDGIGTGKPLEFSFVILPPFWQHWYFYLGLLVLVLTGITLFFRYRIRRVRRRDLFNQRLVEMEMTALRAQMSPHFIFNAINSIHNFVLKGDKNSSTMYLSKFAKLIRNVLENSSQKQISLKQEIETLQLYIEIERMRFSDGFNFRIETDPSMNLSSLMVIPLLLQPYVENAIWHGLLHKKTQGSLLISIKDKGSMLECVIEDDGIGRQQAELNKQQRNAGSNSMGGEISLRRLNLLNNLYGTKFSLTYKDKINPDGTSAGTRVELLIPKVDKNGTYESNNR